MVQVHLTCLQTDPLKWCFCTAYSRIFFSSVYGEASCFSIANVCLGKQGALLEGYICKSYAICVCIFIQKAYKEIGQSLKT